MKLTSLKFISEKREKDLNKLNIRTAEDLVRCFPRSYLDMTHPVSVADCYHNDVALVACRVMGQPQIAYGRRPFVKVWCDQNGARFSAVPAPSPAQGPIHFGSGAGSLRTRG